MAPTKFAAPKSKSSLNILPSESFSQSNSTPIDLSRTTLYQVDYTCVNAGKTVSASKRRIRWRFGFADSDAIDKGLLGPHCRGEEHEIILNWSLTSGKRVLLCDGNEIFVECRPYESTFEYAWKMRGGHELRIKGNVVRALLEKDEKNRQFDLFIDGRSFFDFSEIFHLGRSATRSSLRTTVRNVNNAREIPESEKVDWPRTSFAAPPSKKNENVTPSTVGTAQSFDFRSDGVSTIASSDPISPRTNHDFLGPPPPTMDQVLEAQFSNPPTFSNVQYIPTMPNDVQHIPVYPDPQEYEKQYRHNVMSHQVMQAYQHAPSVASANTVTEEAQPTTNIPEVTITSIPNVEAVPTTPTPVFEEEETYVAPLMTQEAPTLDDISQMLNKLCNVDDITSDPRSSQLTLSMNPTTASTSTKTTDKKKKSNPIAPTEIHYTGPQPSLNEIKVIRHSSSSSSNQSQTIMKSNFSEANSSALVTYGVPPLQRPVGFGVGAQMGIGYNNYAVAPNTATSPVFPPSYPPQPHGVYGNM